MLSILIMPHRTLVEEISKEKFENLSESLIQYIKKYYYIYEIDSEKVLIKYKNLEVINES